jgi:biotin transporter BioY
MIIINSILLSLLIFIAAMIVHSLLVSKDGGILWKIMIGYFTSEIIMLFGFLWLEIYYGVSMLGETQSMLFAVLIPKVVVKVIFFNYTIHKK